MSDKQEVLAIVASDLIDYSLQLQNAVLEGYRVSLDNQLAPYVMGYAMCATLLKEETPSKVVGELEMMVTVDTSQLQDALKTASEAISNGEAYTFEKFAEQSLKIDAEVKKPSGRGRKV